MISLELGGRGSTFRARGNNCRHPAISCYLVPHSIRAHCFAPSVSRFHYHRKIVIFWLLDSLSSSQLTDQGWYECRQRSTRSRLFTEGVLIG